MKNVVLQDGRYLPQVEKERWRTCFIAGTPKQVLFATMCSAFAECDTHFVGDVAFGSDARFARE
ncbi:MAG: hypothetical protein IJZ83_09540 [Clostridia bacterium]|nr:hypothetical protein [Clostridia bacterium]